MRSRFRQTAVSAKRNYVWIWLLKRALGALNISSVAGVIAFKSCYHLEPYHMLVIQSG